MTQEKLELIMKEIEENCENHIFFTNRLDDQDAYMVSLSMITPEVLTTFILLILEKNKNVRRVIIEALIFDLVKE